MSIGILECPKCGFQQQMEIPEDRCIPFYKCENCEELIMAKTCCVFCDYGDRPCSIGRKKTASEF